MTHVSARGQAGQATVEYLVVGVALFIFIAGLAVLWRCISGDGLAAVVEGQVSHELGGIGGAEDVLLF